MKDDYAQRANDHGLFILKNLHINLKSEGAHGSRAKGFVDITFFAKNITNHTAFEHLIKINNTQVATNENRFLEDYSELIKGWGQVIHY